MRQRKLTFALLLALVLIFAGCKSESPTAPPLGTGGGGSVTPPTNASITVHASNSNPVVNSTSVITATVTSNGSNVANGTGVQFTTSLAGSTFTDTGTTSTIKTTTNGVATATLTSSSAGTATVTATVNNASGSTEVTFSAGSVTPPPVSTTPTITSVTPATGLPTGGQRVTITGTNFNEPVRVLFDTGSGTPKEAAVASVSATQLVVLTPSIDLGTGQTQAADIIVITQAGSAAEQRVVKSGGFTFEAAILTPAIRAVEPTSGPVSGGTRITIIGDGFQQPVQVFFGSAEAQVISVTFNQIIVMSPPGRDTTPDGSGTVTGPVDIKVVNVNSNTNTSFTGGFRYTPKMQITTVGPTEGPFTGGTRVRIDGIGFDDPVGVVIGGVAAQVISVSGTEIVAITSPVNLNSCGDVTGPIVVGNTNNGDTATGPDFIYRVPKPLIVNISNPNNLGGTATITVFNALGFPRITIGGVSVSVTATVVNPDGTTTFTVQLPPTIKLQTTSCPAGGTAQIPTAFDVAYTSATTGCTDTSPSGITVLPPATPLLFLNPPTFQPFTATITPNVAPAPPFPGTSVTPSATQTVNIVNNGSAPLTITGITDNGAPACARFSPLPPPATFPLNLNQCEAFPLIEQYFGQTTQGSETCTITISTNAGNKTLLLVGTSQ